MLASVSIALAQSEPADTAYQEGRRHYDLREWDKAIEKFKEAYKLRPDAASLFNIAQSYRLKGDCVEALGIYKTYKRNYPDAQNIAAVDKFIEELTPCANEQATKPAPASEPIKPAQPPPVGAPLEDTQEDDPGAMKRKVGMGLAIGGAAVVAAGVVFGVLAMGKANEVTDSGDVDRPPEFDPSVQRTGQTFDLVAKISWGVGGAALATGVVLYVLGRNDAGAPQVGIAPARDGGAVVSWRVAF